MIPTKKCPHGKLLTQPCLACEKMDKVERHTAQKITDLTAENERLRTALKGLLDDLDTIGVSDDPFILPAITDARAAIAKVGER